MLNRYLLAALVFTAAYAVPILAYDMRIPIQDGLGRPVPGAKFIVMGEIHKNGKVLSRYNTTEFTSGADGVVQLNYDSAAPGRGQVRGVKIIKDGFSPYQDTNPPLDKYTIRRVSQPGAISAMRRLPAEAILPALREHLASEWQTTPNADLARDVFPDATKFLAPLRELSKDTSVRQFAVNILASVGDAGDIRWLARDMLAGTYHDDDFELIAYVIATSMVSPESEEDWEFLRRCGTGSYHDTWAVSGAIQALGSIGSTRSKAMLKDIASRFPDRKKEIEYLMHAKPLQLVAPSINILLKQNLHAIGGGRGKVDAPILFNKARTQAWVTVNEVRHRDLYTYRLRMSKQGDAWEWLGYRMVMQAYLEE